MERRLRRDLSLKEAAAEMEYSQRTLQRYLKAGLVHGRRVGERGHWKVSADEVERVRSGEAGLD